MVDRVKVARGLLGIVREIVADEKKEEWVAVDIDKMSGEEISKILYAINTNPNGPYGGAVEVDGKKYRVEKKPPKWYRLCVLK